MSTTTDLEQVSTGYNALSPEVRERWAIEQVQTIRKTVGKDLSIPEFQMGMATSAKYDLDPLLHEIWFVKGNDGRVMIMTGRDGFLTLARRNPIYEGMAHDVLRANDEFAVEWENGIPNVSHKYKGDDGERGEIKGAWAIAYFTGKKPTYFYAPLSEYMPTNEKKIRYSPWGSQLSVMMLKCAQSYVLRIGNGVTGIVGAEESERALEDRPSGVLTSGNGTGEARGVELPPEVTAIIERAESLGHAGWAERSVWEYRLDRGPEFIRANVTQATDDLDALERQRDSAPITEAVEVDEREIPVDDADLPPIPQGVRDEVRSQWPEPESGVALPVLDKPVAPVETTTAPVAKAKRGGRKVTEPEEAPVPKQKGIAIDVEALRRQRAAVEAMKPKTEKEKQDRDDEIKWIEYQLETAAQEASASDAAQSTLGI